MSFYGLLIKHKKNLAVRSILPATGTFHYALAKWLDKKLKPFSTTNISNIFAFAQEIQQFHVNKIDGFVSYDLSALFTSTPLEETTYIELFVTKPMLGTGLINLLI